MRKRVNNYLAYIDKILAHELPVTASFDADGKYVEKAAKDEAPTRKDYEKLAETHLSQISFFQHERLVHLMVTILFSALTFAVFVLLYIQIGGITQSGLSEGFSWGLLILFLLLVVLEVPYVMHYYLLENSVQKMYKQYDELLKRIRQ
ncbi:MAG: hypothetical protein IKR23_00175 [Lachnospiraceae bacterium]|nr:hypothetical protein [Lachnospiraceae bacterium]